MNSVVLIYESTSLMFYFFPELSDDSFNKLKRCHGQMIKGDLDKYLSVWLLDFLNDKIPISASSPLTINVDTEVTVIVTGYIR